MPVNELQHRQRHRPALTAFEIFELTREGNYQKLVGVTGGAIEAVPACDGLRIDVDALWTELSRLDDAE